MHRYLLCVALAGALAAPCAAGAATKFTRVDTSGGGAAPTYGMVRTPDGVLHLVFQTSPTPTAAPDGLATRAISPAGKLGLQTQALSGYSPGKPGLLRLPSGALEAVFAGVSPANATGVYGIASTDGGATWSTPAVVGAGGPDEALAYGSDITAVLAGTTPAVTLPQAGNIVVQLGLGAGSSTVTLTDASDNAAGGVGSTVDAATGAPVIGWQSLAGNGADFLRAASPLGPAQQMDGQLRNHLIPSGRDTGAGVFAAYTTDNTHVRLQRYGGASVAVGKAGSITAKVLGTATGLDGRIWALWGDESGVALTRSNRAVTRFEPIQVVHPNSFSIYRVTGDGRLGPLDLLVDQIENAKGSVQPGGTFYGRVLPELSAHLTRSGHKLKATVTDAGDPVAGATVSASGKKAKTNAKGLAKLTVAGSGRVHVKVTAKNYNPLNMTA